MPRKAPTPTRAPRKAATPATKAPAQPAKSRKPRSAQARKRGLLADAARQAPAIAAAAATAGAVVARAPRHPARQAATIRAAARRVAFVDAWLSNGGNATQAAIVAGFSPATAYAKGCSLLREARVQQLLAERAKTAAGSVGVTPERVLAEYAAVAFSDPWHYRVGDDGRLDLTDDAPSSARRAVSSVKMKRRVEDDAVTHEVEYKLWSKTDALEKLGKVVELFPKESAGAGASGAGAGVTVIVNGGPTGMQVAVVAAAKAS